jgi:hypothetical protein
VLLFGIVRQWASCSFEDYGILNLACTLIDPKLSLGLADTPATLDTTLPLLVLTHTPRTPSYASAHTALNYQFIFRGCSSAIMVKCHRTHAHLDTTGYRYRLGNVRRGLATTPTFPERYSQLENGLSWYNPVPVPHDPRRTQTPRRLRRHE